MHGLQRGTGWGNPELGFAQIRARGLWPGFIHCFLLSVLREQSLVHEGRADENLRRFSRVHVAVRDLLLLELQAGKGGDLRDEHLAGASAPQGVLVARDAELRRQFHDPLRVDLGGGSGIHHACFYDFTGYDPLRLRRRFWSGLRFLRDVLLLWARCPVEHRGSWEKSQSPIPHALVGIAFSPVRNVAQQPGENGSVNRLVSRVALVQVGSAGIFKGVAELFIQILPFAYSEIG